MTGNVDAYVAALEGWQARVVAELRAHILATGLVTEAFKWSEPVYEHGGPVCWIKAHKAHVTFGFWRGARLKQLDSRLQSSGAKMAHMKLTAPGEITAAEVLRLVRAGTVLNAQLGNPARAI